MSQLSSSSSHKISSLCWLPSSVSTPRYIPLLMRVPFLCFFLSPFYRARFPCISLMLEPLLLMTMAVRVAWRVTRPAHRAVRMKFLIISRSKCDCMMTNKLQVNFRLIFKILVLLLRHWCIQFGSLRSFLNKSGTGTNTKL